MIAPSVALRSSGARDHRRGHRWKNQGERNERNVDHAQRHRVGKVIDGQIPRIEFFANDDPGIGPDFPIQLTVTDVHRVDAQRAFLQQTIGKTAGRRADIEAGLARRIDLEKIQRAFELQPATAHVSFLFADVDRTVGRDASARLVHALPVDEHGARQNRPLRFLAGWEKSAIDEQVIEA